MRRKKKKGETAMWPQIHPRVTVPKWVLISKDNLKAFLYSLGRGN